jgi:hypothetical protein
MAARLTAADLAVAALLMTVSYLLRTLRVYDELRAEFDGPGGGGFAGCLQVSLWHNALVNVTPLRAGELAFPLLLHRRLRVPVARSTATLLWMRLQDAAVVVLLAILIWPGIDPALGLPLVGALIVMLTALLAWSRRARATSRFARLEPLRAALRAATVSSHRGWLWTFGHWSAKLAALALLLGSMLAVPADVAVVGALGGELAAVLPVQGVAGFGTYEAGVGAALYPYAIAPGDALPAALTLHLLVLASAGIAAGAAGVLDARRRPLTGQRRPVSK